MQTCATVRVGQVDLLRTGCVVEEVMYCFWNRPPKIRSTREVLLKTSRIKIHGVFGILNFLSEVSGELMVRSH